MISQEPRNLNSPEVRQALGSRFKHVRMAQGKSAQALAVQSGLTEFELSMIEQGIHENLTQDIVAEIAFNLGLAPKPESSTKQTKAVEKVAKSKKNKDRRGFRLSDEERAIREKHGRDIRAFRTKHSIMASQVEREVGLAQNSLSQLETKGIGLIPGRKQEIMQAIERLAAQQGNEPTKLRGPVITADPVKPKPRGFVVSTEHKLICGSHEFLASVSGDEFTLSISNNNEIMILEGSKKDKTGMLAALKHIISTIES